MDATHGLTHGPLMLLDGNGAAMEQKTPERRSGRGLERGKLHPQSSQKTPKSQDDSAENFVFDDDENVGFGLANQAHVNRLAELDEITFAQVCAREAKDFRVHPAALARLVEKARRELPAKPPAPRAGKIKIISAAALSLSHNGTDWVIYGLKERGTLAVKYGASGSLKTFTEIDELLSIAANRPHHGRKVNGGAAILIAGEGHRGLARRVIGLAEKRGFDLTKIPFYLTTAPVEFLNPDDVAALRPLLDEIASQQPIAAISIDTLSRCFGQGDENSTKDMNRFVAEADTLRRDYGAAVTALHHVGHGDAQRERGAYALRGAADWRWLVEKNQSGLVTLTCKKAKEHEEPPPIAFKAEQYHLKGQFDEEGRPLTTLVLREVEAKTETKTRRLPAAQRIALDALKAILVNKDRAHLDEWRAECYAAGISDTEKGKRMAFNRARTALLDAGHVATRDDFYTLAGSSVTPLTKRNNVTPVTGESVTERNTTLKDVTDVTPPNSEEEDHEYI